MKKMLLWLLLSLFSMTAAQATILPASGVDEAFQAWTGIEATPAVILCERLTVLDARGDQGGKAVDTLQYSGQSIPVLESWDGYAKISYADGSKTGWVRNEYLKQDPAWYVCDKPTAVYAYPEAMSPRVAYLDTGETLPILAEYDDGVSIGGWVCVSLRGAAGWIRKTPQDTASETFFRPEQLKALTCAALTVNGEEIVCTDADTLGRLSALLTNAEDRGGEVSGCPFTAMLTLTVPEGGEIVLRLATDSCCIYRIDGRDYAYARHLCTPEGSPENSALYGLFGISRDMFFGLVKQ
jgi:hypothetical protein